MPTFFQRPENALKRAKGVFIYGYFELQSATDCETCAVTFGDQPRGFAINLETEKKTPPKHASVHVAVIQSPNKLQSDLCNLILILIVSLMLDVQVILIFVILLSVPKCMLQLLALNHG